MNSVKYTSQFKKDYKNAIKRGLNKELLFEVIDYLIKGENLPNKYQDHQLSNSKKYINARECHICPDWLLIYQVINEEMILKLIRTGTHSDLF